jgi:hypothetical protein
MSKPQGKELIGFDARTGVLEMKNRQDFATLEWIRCEWELKTRYFVLKTQ